MSLPLYIYFLIPCIFIGISVYFQKFSPLYLRTLPVLLIINLFVEIFGQWLARKYGTNIVMFNFYMALLVTAHMFLLREMVVGKFIKLIVLNLLWLYPLICIYNILFIQGIQQWHSYSYGIGNVLIVGLAVYYFFELFKRPTSINLIKEPAFWICSALLFYYACSFPFLSLVNLLQKAPLIVRNNLSTILTLLNILQYILFSIAFLCRLKIKKLHFSQIA
jgi:hypothetical protein